MGPDTSMWRTVPPLEQARKQLNHAAFRVQHDLATDPLFQLDQLIDVAKEASRRPGDLYLDAGDVTVTDKWGNIPIPDRPVDEIIKRIETAGAWIILKHVEQDPRYAAVLNEFASFANHIAGPAASRLLNNPEMLVLISSPNRITPFHFDAELNFLIQVRGEKQVWVCDPADRTAITHEEIESYYCVNHNAGTYKPGVEAQATQFHLKPGEGVHIPTHAAHWVTNGNAVSVSLSLNFELPSSMYKDVYRMNHLLRRLGIKPTPPGLAPTRDLLKTRAAATGRVLNRLRGR